MHYYKFNIADWNLGTSHLSLTEQAIYFRLINHYYDTESPIPLETHSVIRRLRLGSNTDEVQLILDEFFEKTEKGYVHSRCEENIKDYKKNEKKNKVNGAKGGRPRKTNASSESQEEPSGFSDESQTKGNHKPLTTNHKPLTTNQLNITPSESDVSQQSREHVPFQEIINLYNEIFPELPAVKIISDKRRQAVKARWTQNKSMQSLDDWRNFFGYIRKSDFLMGRATNWHGLSFDWIFNASNFAKIYEGNYDNRGMQ